MTLYCVEIRPNTLLAQPFTERSDSAIGRALFIIATSSYCTVIRQWEEEGKLVSQTESIGAPQSR